VKHVSKRERWKPFDNARGREVTIEDWFQILMDEGFTLHHRENIKGIIF
jgi:hypothetical protein